MSKIIKVIKVINEYTLVINAGSDDGVNERYEFLIYELGDELFDPDTKESLGQLEIIKGTATPTHIQNKITTIKSNKYIYSSEKKRIIKRVAGLASMFGGEEEIIEPGNKQLKSFDNPATNDLVKIIGNINIL